MLLICNWTRPSSVGDSHSLEVVQQWSDYLGEVGAGQEGGKERGKRVIV